jgi:NAD-reducing hydrogenase large subunit
VDDNGAIWANLIVATGHNNLAIGRGVLQVAKRFVGKDPGGASTASALVRAYDPCLSCPRTPWAFPVALELGPDGRLLDAVGPT